MVSIRSMNLPICSRDSYIIMETGNVQITEHLLKNGPKWIASRNEA